MMWEKKWSKGYGVCLCSTFDRKLGHNDWESLSNLPSSVLGVRKFKRARLTLLPVR